MIVTCKEHKAKYVTKLLAIACAKRALNRHDVITVCQAITIIPSVSSVIAQRLVVPVSHAIRSPANVLALIILLASSVPNVVLATMIIHSVYVS